VLSFSTVVGHRRLTMLLSQAIARETLPPTLLFAGPSGVGKFVVARAAAAAINCLSPVRDRSGFPFDACGVCRSCDRVRRNVHVDVLAVEPDDRASIKIDVIRDVLERTAFRPFEGRRRVVIIRDAETLEVSAQNALLKSLEEPPPGTVFCLTTAVASALLPTVRSRCMWLRFGRLTEREVTEVLVRHHRIAEQEARGAAAHADGRVGEALALWATDVAILREAALLLLRQAASGSAVPGRLQAAAVLSGSGTSRKERPREEVGLLLRMLASMLRDLELLNNGADVSFLANPVIADELASMARGYGGDRAREAFAAVDRAIMALDRNAGTKVVSEWLAVQL
jgi:DNA polymerase III subunit delta'